MSLKYYAGDLVSEIVRFDGSVVSNTYDKAARLATTRYGGENGRPSTTIRRTYHADGELHSIADGTASIAYEYDWLNRPTSITSSVASASLVAEHLYDGVNRTNSVVGISNGEPGIMNIEFSYDSAERLVEITAKTTKGTQEYRYCYNPENGKIASVSNAASGLVCAYEYDLMDRATNITYSLCANVVSVQDYVFNAVSMITNKTIQIGSANSISTAYAYDSIDRLVRESVASSVTSVSSEVNYTYDLAGNRIFKSAENSGLAYVLGSGNRLDSTRASASKEIFISGGSDESIGLDDRWGACWFSNLTANTDAELHIDGHRFNAFVPVLPNQTNTLAAAIRDAAGNTTFITNAYWVGELATTGANETKHYTYDTAGCLTNRNGVSLRWDERYRLKSVKSAQSVDISYEYDVLGRRISRQEIPPEGGTTNLLHYIYNGNQIAADLDGDGNEH